MINFDCITKEYIKEHNGHNPKWPKISDHSYRILKIGGSGSRNNKCIVKPNK